MPQDSDRVATRGRAAGLAVLFTVGLVACGGGGGDAAGGAAQNQAQTATPPQAGDTGAAAAPAAPTPSASGPAADPSSVTPQAIALGDSVFKGQAGGGTCYVCHGMEAKGGPVGPDLTDGQWLNGDGSLGFIASTVRQGVPQPKQFPAPMPPMGGASLSEEHVNAVAAYVYSLSHKGAGS